MKLLPTEFSVKWKSPDSFDEYARFYPSFAWIGETINGQAKQLFRWTTCREIFTANLKKDIVEKHNNICADHTRFVLKSVYSKASPIFKHNGVFKFSDKAMETAMNVLNIIEKKAGWDLTTITKLKKRTFTNANDDNIIINTYIIMGPKEWIRSTPLISLYTLIVRSGWFKEFSEIKQVEDIAPVCKKIVDTPCIVDKIRQHMYLIDESYEYWLLLILNEKKLFGKRKPIAIYNKNEQYSGIAKLITSSHDIDSTTRRHWAKLIKEHKK